MVCLVMTKPEDGFQPPRQGGSGAASLAGQGFAAVLGAPGLPLSPVGSRRAPVQGRAHVPRGAGMSGAVRWALPWLLSVTIQVRSQNARYSPEWEQDLQCNHRELAL